MPRACHGGHVLVLWPLALFCSVCFCFHSNAVMTNATATKAIEWLRAFRARAISYSPSTLHTITWEEAWDGQIVK